jgi:hypothetical protein
MIALRSASVRLPQAAISASVRPQPMQRPVCPLTAQTLMQGLEIGAGVIVPRAKPLDLVEQLASEPSVSFFDNLTLTVDTTYRISISA